MSKKTKAAGKKKRLEERRKAKAARYAKHKERVNKSRVRRKAKAPSVISHPNGRCGNPACEKCFGITFSRLFFRNGKPHGMPQKMYMKWKEQHVQSHA